MATKTKINKYWKNDGTCVKAHLRGGKTQIRQVKRSGEYRTRRLAVLCWFMFIVCAGGIGLNYTETSYKPEIKDIALASEPGLPITNLDKGQGFESADMPRDTVERELPRDESIEDKIRKAFGKDGDKAVKIAFCESGLNPLQVNDNPKTRDYSIGLFQVNLFGKLARTRPSEDWLKNPDNNISYAKMLFDSANGRFGRDWVRCSRKNGLK